MPTVISTISIKGNILLPNESSKEWIPRDELLIVTGQRDVTSDIAIENFNRYENKPKVKAINMRMRLNAAYEETCIAKGWRKVIRFIYDTTEGVMCGSTISNDIPCDNCDYIDEIVMEKSKNNNVKKNGNRDIKTKVTIHTSDRAGIKYNMAITSLKLWYVLMCIVVNATPAISPTVTPTSYTLRIKNR